MVAPQHNIIAAPWRYAQVAPMDDAEFDQWVRLLEERTGINLPRNRKSFLLTSLAVRMREQGITSYQEYYDFLTQGTAGRVEWETLVDRLTVHETRFYRDDRALSVVRDLFLPSCQAEPGKPLQLHYWSVGCASGEEPYTLAMLTDDYFQHHQQPYHLGITASDISSDALATARRAVYPKNRMTNTPTHWRSRYCTVAASDRYEIKEEIKKRICFTRINLLEIEDSPVGMMDLIYCQNVLIYFKRPMRLSILNNLAKHLKPGGMLILGAGEIIDWNHPELENVSYKGALVFRRQQVEGKGKSL
jgi:chemotaxis methyl-accepting protein methylase